MTNIEKEIQRFMGVHPDTKLVAKAVTELEELFSRQGHSGFSAHYVFSALRGTIEDEATGREKLQKLLDDSAKDLEGYRMQCCINHNILEVLDFMKPYDTKDKLALIKLLEGKPLTPLMGTEDEWELNKFYGCGSDEPYTVYSNTRCHTVTKYVLKDGIEICTYLHDQTFSDNGGYTHYTTGSFGRRQITFPFEVPERPEVVYLYEVEDRTPFILTDPKTIEQVRRNYEERMRKERESENE